MRATQAKYEAKKLARQVNVNGRVKTMNERIYYSVDKIHEALNEESQIKFQYFTWTADKKMELKHGGAYYSVSPWALCWDDEKYYLVGYDNREYKIKHFRVDKMVDVSVIYEDRGRKRGILENADVGVHEQALRHVRWQSGNSNAFV